MVAVHNKTLGISIGSQAAERLKAVVPEARLDDILKDRKLHRIEAPKLFDGLFKAASFDCELAPEEAESYSSAFSAGLSNVPSIFGMRGLVEREIEKMSASADDKEIKRIVDDIKYADQTLGMEIEFLEDRVKQLRDEEASFWNYVSAGNTLGVSGWAPTYWNMLWGEEEYDDCKTLSSAEFDGARDFLRELYSIQAGLRILKGGIEAGVVIERNEFVQEFLKSPFADFANVTKNLGLNSGGNTQRDNFRSLGFFRIRQALKYGATRLAYNYAEVHKNSFPENSEFVEEKIMPSWLFQVADQEIGDFANVAVSLDSLLIISGALSLGQSMGAVGAAKYALRLGGFAKLEWPARFLIPGVPLFNFASKTKLVSLSKIILNMGYELGKLSAYMNIGAWIDGNDGAETAANICLFSGGLVAGFMSSTGQIFMREVMGGEIVSPTAVAPRVLTEFADDYYNTLAAYAGGTPVLNRFSLAKALPLKEWTKMVSAFLSKIDTLIRNAYKALNRVDALLGQIKRIAEDNAQFLNTKKYLTEARRIAYSRPMSNAMVSLEKLLDKLREDVSSAGGGSARTPKILIRRIPETRGRGGGGGGSKAYPVRDVGKEAVEATVDVAQRSTLSETLTAFIKKPPPQLDIDLIAKETSGKVIVDEPAVKSLLLFYENTNAPRSAFWRAVKEMADIGDFLTKHWKLIHQTSGGYRRHIGSKYRLIVMRGGDGIFHIRNIQASGALHRGGKLKDAL